MKILNKFYSDEVIQNKQIIPEELGGVDDDILTDVICALDDDDINGKKSFNKLQRYVAFRLMAEQARLEYSASLA